MQRRLETQRQAEWMSCHVMSSYGFVFVCLFVCFCSRKCWLTAASSVNVSTKVDSHAPPRNRLFQGKISNFILIIYPLYNSHPWDLQVLKCAQEYNLVNINWNKNTRKWSVFFFRYYMDPRDFMADLQWWRNIHKAYTGTISFYWHKRPTERFLSMVKSHRNASNPWQCVLPTSFEDTPPIWRGS